MLLLYNSSVSQIIWLINTSLLLTGLENWFIFSVLYIKHWAWNPVLAHCVYAGCPNCGDEHSEQCISYNFHRALFSGVGSYRPPAQMWSSWTPGELTVLLDNAIAHKKSYVGWNVWEGPGELQTVSGKKAASAGDHWRWFRGKGIFALWFVIEFSTKYCNEYYGIIIRVT